MTGTIDKPIWEIDRIPRSCVGAHIRVGAKAFAPLGEDRQMPPRLIPANCLILPDNTAVEGQPVFFEGRLEEFTRQIRVVHVYLAAPDSVVAQGMVLFPERSAAILPGPAIVQLAFPFHVERLPSGEDNYWRDLRLPHAQFLLRFQD